MSLQSEAEAIRIALDSYIALRDADDSDKCRLDWLSQDETRIQGVYWRVVSEGEDVRLAIDRLCELQKAESVQFAGEAGKKK